VNAPAYDPKRLETACRRVIAHCDAVLAAFVVNNALCAFPWQRLDEIDFRRVQRVRESAVLILHALETGREPPAIDIARLLRGEVGGSPTRDVFVEAMAE
jgi:hypothetical protein